MQQRQARCVHLQGNWIRLNGRWSDWKECVSDTELLQPLWPITVLSQSLQPYCKSDTLVSPQSLQQPPSLSSVILKKVTAGCSEKSEETYRPTLYKKQEDYHVNKCTESSTSGLGKHFLSLNYWSFKSHFMNMCHYGENGSANIYYDDDNP